MPSLSRRQLLGGSAALAAGTYGAYSLYRGAPDADFASWTPDAGTWPLERYDPANTAHNPNASPPRESPARREVLTVPDAGDDPYFHPLVGPNHLALAGTRLAAYPPGGGDPVLTTEAGARVSGFGPDGRLHSAQRRAVGGDAVVGYAGDGLSETYRHELDDGHVDGMTVGRSEVYVGTSSREVVALHPGHGEDWRVGGTMPALADGRLYATAPLRDGFAAYRERSGLDRRTAAGPTRVWSADGVGGQTHLPAVADGRVVYGTFDAVQGGALVALDAATGESLWDPRALGVDVATPAVDGDRGYVAAGTDGLRAGLVAAVDLTTGDTVWRDEVDWYAYSPVLAGDTLVVAGEVRDGSGTNDGKVRAYDAPSGEVLWTVTFDGTGAGSLAVADERIVATVGASLYALWSA